MILDRDFTMIPNAVLLDDTLQPTTRLVFFYLLMRSYGAKDHSWASQGRMARELGISRRTVVTAIQVLENKRLLDKMWHPEAKTLLYRVLPNWMCANSAQAV